MAEALGVLGLAANFIQASHAATMIQELLRSLIVKQPNSGLKTLESRLASFRASLDFVAQTFIAGSHESGSAETYSLIQQLLVQATDVLSDLISRLRTVHQVESPTRRIRRFESLARNDMFLDRNMSELERIQGMMLELLHLLSISRLRAEIKDQEPASTGPISQDNGQAPASSTSEHHGASDCYPKHVKNRQKRFFDKMLFESQPEKQHCIVVTKSDSGNTVIPAIAPLSDEIWSNLSTTPGSRASGSTKSSCDLLLIVCEGVVGAHNTLPFERTKFIEMVDATHAPLGFFQALLLGTPKFVHYVAGDNMQQPGLVLRTPSSLTENWTLALSWDPEYRFIRGVIHGLSARDMGFLAMHLGDTQEECAHPLNIPVVVCEMLVERDSNGVKSETSNLHKVELQTNYSGYVPSQTGDKDVGEAKVPQSDFPEMTRKLNVIISQLAFHEMRVHANGVFVEDMIICLASWITYSDENMKGKLRERLAHLRTEQRALLLDISCSQKIAQSQLQIVYNLIAQRDNKTQQTLSTTQTDIAKIQTGLAKTTKEDSFAMRTLAVMSIAFLPGTFVSSFFSMDMFNWDAPRGTPVLSSRFWIYWAVTVPLTFVVFCVWSVWVRRHDRDTAPSTTTASEISDEPRPWYQRFHFHKSSEDEEKQEAVESVTARQSLDSHGASLRLRTPVAQVVRNETFLQNPIRGLM
ncbi:hypothetical protein DE146DRAFT_109470 [Phaeosphaeria sp. MPI-PUGE-AT-0046c]|nr:hypothetical protein DE146DRAFT_109470 [Phaeosphaeria sp. MPI-PUGE-AT-0046c]